MSNAKQRIALIIGIPATTQALEGKGGFSVLIYIFSIFLEKESYEKITGLSINRHFRIDERRSNSLG